MDEQIQDLLKLKETIKTIGVTTDRENANVGNNFSAKLLQIASAANKVVQLQDQKGTNFDILHKKGYFHQHDLDSFNLTVNCLQINTKDALKNGFNTGYGTIREPKNIISAASLSCILLQSTQNDMFGGQSHVDFDNHLGAYVQLTRTKIKEELHNNMISMGVLDYDQDMFNKLTEKKVEKEVEQACQNVVYNLNSMASRAGAQVPFSSVNIGWPDNDDAALVCKHFLQEYNKGLGKGEQPIFPSICFRVKEGINKYPEDKYYYLYRLACKVAANRLMPMFINCDASFEKDLYSDGTKPNRMGWFNSPFIQ
jgi:ribonucleoside-triphosphate reductase (formate)